MVHILEAVKDKAGPNKEIYPYALQEVRPILNVLGLSMPEEQRVNSPWWFQGLVVIAA